MQVRDYQNNLQAYSSVLGNEDTKSEYAYRVMPTHSATIQ